MHRYLPILMRAVCIHRYLPILIRAVCGKTKEGKGTTELGVHCSVRNTVEQTLKLRAEALLLGAHVRKKSLCRVQWVCEEWNDAGDAPPEWTAARGGRGQTMWVYIYQVGFLLARGTLPTKKERTGTRGHCSPKRGWHGSSM